MFSSKRIEKLEENIYNITGSLQKLCKHEEGFDFIRYTINYHSICEKKCRICGKGIFLSPTEFLVNKEQQEYEDAKKIVKNYEENKDV